MKQTGKPLCPSIMMDHKDLLEDWAGFQEALSFAGSSFAVFGSAVPAGGQ
jgi:hypothetical protein